MAELLLASSSFQDILEDSSSDNNSLLHCASLNKDLPDDLTERFLNIFQYNLDPKNNLGQTPLHIALASGNNVFARKLIMLGANVELTDNFGNTIWQLAGLGNTSNALM